MTARRSGPGCFGYGCVIAIVLFTVAIGGIAWWGIRSTQNAVHRYTKENAPALIVAPVEDGVQALASSKVQNITKALTDGGAATERFSEAEVRSLIQSTPWRDRVDLSFVGNEAQVRFSFPLSAVGEWKAARALVGDIAERWAAGSARGALVIQDGAPKLTLSELTLADNELGDIARGHAAEWISGAIAASVNVTESVEEVSPNASSVASPLTRLRSLRVENGGLEIEVSKK